MKTTGRYRFRTTLFGKLVLQYETSCYDGPDPNSMGKVNKWQDAKLEHLLTEVKVKQKSALLSMPAEKEKGTTDAY